MAQLKAITLQGFYTMDEVLSVTSFSRSTLLREVERGQFPRPVKLAEARIGFPKPEVDAWVKLKLQNARV